MGYVLKDRIEISLFLDGEEFPLEHSNTLDGLIIECRIGTILPTIYFQVTDALDYIQTRNSVFDGSSVSVVVKGPGDAQARTLNFRVFKYRNETTQIGSQWTVDGYFDYVKYWLQTTNAGIRGTSAYVIQQIANMAGLKVSAEGTSDSQLWMPQNKTLGEWVRSLVAYGFVSDTSYMAQGVDLAGTLHYKDFNKPHDPVATLVYGQYQQGQIPIMDFAPSGNSGFANRLTGYNNVMHSQSTVRPSEMYDKLAFKPDSQDPLFNRNIKAGSSRGYHQFGALDFGNVHEASDRAFYQNMRYANLYNLSVTFMTTLASNINIFDVVNFIPRTTMADSVYSGTYKITAYQMKVQAMSYTEFLRGVRHGTNNAKP